MTGMSLKLRRLKVLGNVGNGRPLKKFNLLVIDEFGDLTAETVDSEFKVGRCIMHNQTTTANIPHK